jgi:hypothetical protein
MVEENSDFEWFEHDFNINYNDEYHDEYSTEGEYDENEYSPPPKSITFIMTWYFKTPRILINEDNEEISIEEFNTHVNKMGDENDIFALLDDDTGKAIIRKQTSSSLFFEYDDNREDKIKDKINLFHKNWDEDNLTFWEHYEEEVLIPLDYIE